jgi:hypothetical protein
MTFNFIGGAYQSPSLRANAQDAVNLYVEADESGSGKSKLQLVGTPGLVERVDLSPGPIRGIWIGEERMFVVSDFWLYEVHEDYSFTLRGNVETDGKPVQIFPNGNQIAIISNNKLWVDSGSGPVQATYAASTGTCTIFNILGEIHSRVTRVSGDPFYSEMAGRSILIGAATHVIDRVVSSDLLLLTVSVPNDLTPTAFSITGGLINASAGGFLDGYAVVSFPNSRNFAISGLYDFATWDPLDIAVKEGYPDPVRRPFALNEDMYIFGSQTTEVVTNTGNADFPLERRPGMVYNFGLVSRDAVDRLGDGLAFLGNGGDRGAPVAYYMAGYRRERISTHAIEKVWETYTTVADAQSYSYEEDGHQFWVLTFPTADATWCYDLKTKFWHRRASFASSILHRHRATFHGYVWGKHFVGDYETGKIYQQSLDYTTEAGVAILRQRTAPHISEENHWVFYKDFSLDIQTGEVSHPQFQLDWSNDGGVTWRQPRSMDGGPAGIFGWRVIARRLGRARDRVFRVTSLASMRHVWIEAYVDAQAGNG